MNDLILELSHLFHTEDNSSCQISDAEKYAVMIATSALRGNWKVITILKNH